MSLLLLLACTELDLSPEWELDRLRLLAIRAEPAEPRPGETVAFTSLSYVPDGAEWSAVWFACVTAAGCTLDPALLEGLDQAETPEEQAELMAALAAAGFIGAEPGFPPSWPVPADALDGLTEAEALEGVGANVQVTLTAADDTELVLRRMPVSLAATPNLNPDIGGVLVDGDPVEADGTFTADAGETFELRAVVAGGLEDYLYTNTDGEVEERTEDLEWRWYAELGTLNFGDDDIEGASTMEWTAPDSAGESVLHAVVLDGRGGMGWWTVHAEVR